MFSLAKAARLELTLPFRNYIYHFKSSFLRIFTFVCTFALENLGIT